ncbi:MAG: DNA-processing protein DprA [Candidatus Latescibacterota bacterium]|nr:DNA-processing protein DprA [Candidatus Latescibacterota bacterium]
MPEGREEIVALLALERVEGIGHERLRRLLAHFGSARAALEAADWAVAVGRGGPWRRPGQAEFAWAEAQWERCDAEGGRCLAPVDADYPELLRHIPAPPPLLFALGPDDLAGPTVAIVGPRKTSEYGLQVAGELAHGLALRGICIVSGLAYGIDGAAHEAALKADGRTIAVLGCGADVPYPRAHTGFYRQIRERGAIVSEFAWGAQPDRGSFPRRNRIISGLSLGIIAVEAPQKSGSLITVHHAVDQNREVFAVPGDVRSGLSAGCHQLLREGAKLVEGVDDVVEELTHWVPPAPGEAPAPELPPEDERVYALLSREPRHIDELAQDSTLPPQTLLDALLRLELEGLVDQLAGKRFLRRMG